MSSLDNIYDIIDKLKKDKIEFVLITVKRGSGKKNKNKLSAKMFYNIPSEKSKAQFQNILDSVSDSMHDM